MPEQIVAEREERPLGRMCNGQGGHSPGFLERRYLRVGKDLGASWAAFEVARRFRASRGSLRMKMAHWSR
jgi:hypothetical protein